MITMTRFKDGDPVPAWLLVVEPRPGEPETALSFSGDIEVIDTPQRFIVVPSVAGGGIVFDRVGAYAPVATGKSVLVMISGALFDGPDTLSASGTGA